MRSNGVFGIQIEDSKKFLVKLVGTLPIFDKAGMTKYFRGLYITKVKDAISSYLVHKQISILEINAYIDELSTHMKERIEPVMADFGIRLVSFYVNDISVPEDDPAVKQLKDALAKRAEMNIIGYSYQQERSFDTLEGAAKNSSATAAPIMGAGMGLGMGLGVGASVGKGFGNMAQELNVSEGAGQKECPQCHARMPASQRFCGMCGCDTEKADEKKAAKAVCSSCGAALTQKQKFCLECGRKLNLCPQCGNDMPDGASTCPACGYAVPTLCPACGKPVRAGAKFCPECGTTLARKCPNCGAAIEGSPKFCPECGQAL